ncbi:MAG: right-handed parallel beta-helix repeat-containing protein [Acidobacteria bacterium]|nr:right-handed parallel beta-helix repeat-containing protein [Acidobacteriota bacterium]MCL5288196.1 right-handed parallel beta-helix repeat-containing protein [Acidobacteriota bacterium]
MRKLFAFLAVALLFPVAASSTTNCVFTTDSVSMTMTLTADCWTDATITIPDGWTLDGANFTITAIDPPSGHFLGAVIKNAGASAHVKNLTVTASNLADVCDPSSPTDTRLRGIMFAGASGTIMNNTVTDINQGTSGCQEGNGIEVRNAPFDGTHPATVTVTVSGNTVTNYQKNGITANGDVAATITDNIVTGAGPVAYIAQNGIQLGYGATGIVMKNKVAGNFYTGASWASSGLLLFEANDTMVHQNEVSGSQIAVAIEAWCLFAPAASENRVVQNTITGAQWGVSIAAYFWSPNSTCNSSADNNKVVNNSISGTSGDTGVSIGALTIAGTGTASAYNNKTIRNTITGFTVSIDDWGGSASKVHANRYEP